MSNINDENDQLNLFGDSADETPSVDVPSNPPPSNQTPQTPARPSPSAGVTSGGVILPPPGTRIPREATLLPGGSGPGRNWSQQVVDILEKIRLQNDRIRINTETTANYLREHRQDINRAQSIAQDAKQQAERFPVDDPRRPLSSRRDLLLPVMQEQFRNSQAELARATGAGLASQLEHLQLTDASGRARIGGTVLEANRVEQIVKQYNEGSLDKADAVAQQFAARVEDALTRRVVRQATPEQLAQALRLENIAEGRGTLANVRRSIPLIGGVGMHGHHMGTMGPTVPSGDFSLVQDEMGTRVPAEEELGNRQTYGGRFAAMLARNSTRTGMGGMLSRFGIRALGGEGLAAAIPGVGEALMAVSLLQHFGRDIPLVGSAMQLRQEGIQSLQTGQLTGEGIRAGLSARFDAARLTPGGVLGEVPVIGGIARTVGGLLHPFDPISNQIANEIVQSVRTQGFTGDRARELYSGVADVYRDLGLSVEQSTEMITTAMRQGGESFHQIVQEMKGFDDAAKALSENINDYSASVQQTATYYRQRGAGPAATGLATSLEAAMPRQLRGAQNAAARETLLSNFAPLIAAQLGVPQQLLGLQRNAGRAQAALAPSILGYLSSMPGRDENEKIAYATQIQGSLLYGLSFDQVKGLITRAQQTRGTQAQGQFRAAERDYRQELSRATPTRRLSAYDMNDAQLRALGITRQRSMLGTPRLLDRHGNAISRDQMFNVRVRGDLDSFSDQQLEGVRQPIIDRLAKAHLIEAPGIKRLENLIHDRSPDKFLNEIEKIRSTRGPGRNIFDTPYGEIKITMGPGLRRILSFQTDKSKWRQGKEPSNRTLSSEDARILSSLFNQ